MIEQFKINIYSDDANFCSSLAIECNKYGFDLSLDENISTKKYNPNCCLARLWKSDANYIPNAGGFSDIQCTSSNIEGEKYCQCHFKKSLENNLPFGSIHEPPPEEPIIKDINGEELPSTWFGGEPRQNKLNYSSYTYSIDGRFKFSSNNILAFYQDLSSEYGFEIYPNADRLYSMSCLKNIGRRVLCFFNS